LFTEELGLRGS